MWKKLAVLSLVFATLFTLAGCKGEDKVDATNIAPSKFQNVKKTN